MVDSSPDADVPARAPRFVIGVDDDDGTVQVAVDGQSFVVSARQARELAPQLHKALRYLAGSSLIAGTDLPIDLEPASEDPTFHEDTLYRSPPDRAHPDRPTVTIRGDNPAGLIRLSAGSADVQLDYETTRVLEHAMELASRIGWAREATPDRPREPEASQLELELERTLRELDATYIRGLLATPVTWYRRPVYQAEARPDQLPPIPGFVIAAEAANHVVALRVGIRSFRIDIASAKLLLTALAKAGPYAYRARFHADRGMIRTSPGDPPQDPLVVYESKPSKRYPNRAAVRATVGEGGRLVVVALNGVAFPVDSDAIDGLRFGLDRAVSLLAGPSRAPAPASVQEQAAAPEAEGAHLRVVESGEPPVRAPADAPALATPGGGPSQVDKEPSAVASPAAPEPQQAARPGQYRGEDDPFADDRAEYLMARNISIGGGRGRLETAHRVAVVLGFILTVASLSTVLGGGALLLAVLAFPVTLIIGPVYVAIALGQWLPLALVYGATAILIGASWIESRS